MQPVRFNGTFFIPTSQKAFVARFNDWDDPGFIQHVSGNDPDFWALQPTMQPDQNSNGQFFRLHVPSKAQALVGGETLGGIETVVKAADLLVQEKIPFKYTPNEVNSSVSEPLTAPNPDDDIKVAGSIARNKVFEWLPVDHTGTNPFQISSSLTASTRAVSAVASVTLAPSLQERIAGSLLALASGDSLGCNVEFNTPAQIAQKFGVHKDITGGSTGPTHPYEYPKGAVTDDTQMTELLAESLITHPEGNLWDLLNRFIAWIKPNPPGTGSGTRQVLAKAELLDPAKDKPTDAAKALWEANAKNGGGNGSIMRCSPIALLYANKPDKLRQLSLDTCALTHYSPAAKASTLAYNRILAAIINGTAKDHDSFLKAYEDAAKEAEAIDPDTAKAIRDVSQIKDKNTLQTSGYTLHTLQVALWALLNCDTLENAVVTAVNLGGDTDSNGAVTGALFGALQGKNAVPKRWTQCLLNTSQLENLAERLYQTHQKLGTTAS